MINYLVCSINIRFFDNGLYHGYFLFDQNIQYFYDSLFIDSSDLI